MRAVSRLGLAMVAAGLALAPTAGFAQSAPDIATPPPPANNGAVGPRELSNFSLGGTVTRPADTPPATAPARARATTTATAPPASSPRQAAALPSRESPQPARSTPATTSSSAAPGLSQPSGLGQPAVEAAPVTARTSLPDALPITIAPSAPADASDNGRKLAVWPWLLLAAAVGIGGALLLRRRRSREAFANDANDLAYVSPEPTPTPTPRVARAPAPAEPPKPATAPKSLGVVSSKLRPWLDLAFAPVGCTVDDERVVIEFDVQVTNSGSAPARDVLIEASMFNGGASQDNDIGAFFANPVGQGERIPVIAPLQHIAIRSSLVAPRQNIQEFELGGHKVFVPLVAFNALYRQSGGPAQTSAAFLLGRETKGDKLGPFRADDGPKAFNKLDGRLLPVGLRT